MHSHQGAGAGQRRARRVLQPIANRLWDFELSGYEHLPADGPAILCPNHISFFDSAALALTMSRNVSFVGKAEYMDSWKTRRVLPALGMIPIDRSGGDKSAAALEVAADVLRRGELFAIYPEGTRSRTGNLHKGRTGAARLAMELQVPIYPVGISGTDQIQPPDTKMPRIGQTCRLQIGRPIRPERYAGRAAEHLAWRSMMDEVMYEIREMTGQNYVHHYAGHEPGGDTEPVTATRVASVTDLADVRQAPRERELVASASS